MREGLPVSQTIETSVLSNVLSLKDEEVSEFIREAMSSKQLSTIMHDLNTGLLEGGPEEQTKAAMALSRLGFVS